MNALTALLVDDIGNFYIADTGNHRVRLITAATGVITTFADAGGTTYNRQELGAPTAMNISAPSGLALDINETLYISNAALNRIFIIAIEGYGSGPFVGRISTGAGTSGNGAYTTAAEENVDGIRAHLNAPHALTSDSTGAVYVADTGSNRVRKLLTPTNIGATYRKIATVAGNGADYSAATEGAAAIAVGIGAVNGLTEDINGNLYIASGLARA